MKRIGLLLIAIMIGSSALAQGEFEIQTKNVRKKFFNISYISDKVKLGDLDLGGVLDEAGSVMHDNTEGIKNNWGISLTRGRSYMLHKKPIARLISIGIDASFFDVSYSNYTIIPSVLGAQWSEDAGRSSDELMEETDLHKIEYSFQVGPSITITPGKRLTIAAYARYAPTFSAFIADGSFSGNYASMFVGGASIAYKKIGVGIEARMGAAKYKNFSGDLDFSSEKIKTSGFRAFLQFRF